MSITMTEQSTGMVLPRCTKCGKDIFCKDVFSMQELQLKANRVIQVTPAGLGNDLVGQGLTQDAISCSACLHQSNLIQLP